MSKEIKICFVCMGNTCRSIMAERLLKFFLKQNKINSLKVLSKGLCANGENIAENAKQVLKEYGALSKDRKSVRLKKIEQDVLYIAMTENIKSQINGKVICVRDLIGEEINDPFMKDISAYRKTAQQIVKANKVLIDKILNLRGEK